MIHPVTPDRLDDLAALFKTHASTRGCYCMCFRGPRRDFVTGWDGGNKANFERLAKTDDPPPGLLAYRDDEPVGWCSVGPRSRYDRAISQRAVILKERDPAEDDDVWLVPCFFVRVGKRKHGTTYQLLNAAVTMAQQYDATAIEGFPLAGNRRNDAEPIAASAVKSASADGYLGRESLFAACGFEPIARPTPRRVVMRRDLT